VGLGVAVGVALGTTTTAGWLGLESVLGVGLGPPTNAGRLPSIMRNAPPMTTTPMTAATAKRQRSDARVTLGVRRIRRERGCVLVIAAAAMVPGSNRATLISASDRRADARPRSNGSKSSMVKFSTKPEQEA
jgi:hypothetical protein